MRKLFCDFDGTLVDISDRHYLVYCETVRELGGAPLPKDEYWNLKRAKTKWDVLLPQSQLSPNNEKEFLRQFIMKIESIPYLKIDEVLPGALTKIAQLTKDYDCYLVSLRRNRQHLLEQIAWLSVAPYFTEVVTGHSENDGYDVKMELIGARLGGESGIIIGDTEADIVTGKELGLTTIAVTSGIRDEQFLKALSPDSLVSSIAEISL